MSTTAADNFSALPTEVGRAQIEYPFKKNGDRTTRVVKRTYKQLAGNFTPTALGSPDATFSDHYLIEETDPQPTQTGLEAFTRTYSTIPTTQTVPSSVILSKPSLSGTFPQVYGSYRLIQADTSLLRFEAYAAKTAVSDTGAPGFYPTGGTYTLTFGGSTTAALAYSASAADVQNALNALTPITNRGNVTVSGSYNSAGGFVITFNAHDQITIAIGSLTGGSITKTEAVASGGYVQSVAAGVAATPAAITMNYGSLVTTQGAGLGIATVNYDSAIYGINSGWIFVMSCAGGSTYFTGGTYTLTISGLTTTALAYNATTAQIEAAINALGVGTVSLQAAPATLFSPSVTRGPGLDPGLQIIAATAVWQRSAPTGGTYTLTAFSSTTGAIAYNATAATVQTALNALTPVSNRGSCVVSGDLFTGFSVSFSNAVLTATASSLTPTNSTATPSITDGTIGRVQKLALASSTAIRDIVCTAHGFSVSDVLFVKGASVYYGSITNFSIPSADTIRLTVNSGSSYASAGTITEIGRRTVANYEPGALTIRCRRITDFYLPGVSSGITTADDIDVPFAQSDGPSLLLAILAGTGTFNVSVGELTQWRDGPILSLTKTTINAADV